MVYFNKVAAQTLVQEMLPFRIVLLIFLIQNVCVLESVRRFKRALIFPPTAPTRTQFICGVGIPLFLEQQSVTTGYVIKAEYFLPTVASEIRPIVIPPPNYTIITTNAKRSVDGIKLDFENGYEIPAKSEPFENYMMLDNTRQVDSEFKNKFIRWALYQTFQKFAERLGLIGRPCILRAICEMAESPLTHHSGIVGEILHLLLTPSASNDPIKDNSDNEYIHAENLGKSGAPCGKVFKECDFSLLEIISKVYSNDDFLNTKNLIRRTAS